MVSITHFSHKHPLILQKQLPDEGGKLVCYGCDEQLLSNENHDSDIIDVYGCETCKTFFLHKSCVELPLEIVINAHKHHSLFLLSNTPAFYYISFPSCVLCKNSISGSFFYHCSLCYFDLDIKCALEKKDSLVHFRKDLILNHPSHKDHPLTLQPRPTSFRCDACGVEDKDLSYHCSYCHYLIHRRCARLPSITHHDVHTHPLFLSFGFPYKYSNSNTFCGICGDQIYNFVKRWVYYCAQCIYAVHIKCIDIKDITIYNLLSLPMNDTSVELIQRSLLKNNSLGNVQHEVSIFNHKHPLLYSDEQILEYKTENSEEVLCDGCIEPIISPPYYHCAECRYFLHLPCARLPQEFQYYSNKHPLILTAKSKFYDEFQCLDCERKSNGFFFSFTSEGCSFYLDVKCAALPNPVLHKSHNHPLLWQVTVQKCKSCGVSIDDLVGCNSCKFYLDRRCLMLPETVKHRFDSKHPLKLRYPPHHYHPRPFDCAECEKEIDPEYWLYHCEECDLSFHVYCINLSWKHHNSKFGQKLRIISHQHPLKYVFKASVRSTCHGCGTEICDYFALECETCNFHLCQSCVREIEL